MKKQFLILFAFISVLALSQVPQRFNRVIVTGDITSPKFIKTGSTVDSVLLGNGSARSVNSIKTDTTSLSNRINLKENLLPSTPSNPESRFLNGNKQWAEIVLGSGGYASNVYFTNLTSAIVGTYKQTSATHELTETIASGTCNNNEVLIHTYLFEQTVGITTVDAGVWRFTMNSKINSSVGDSKFKIVQFKRSSTGIESDMFTIYSNTIENTDYQNFIIETVQPSFLVDSLDRFGCRIYATTTTTVNKTISYKVGDGYASYLNTPLALRHQQLRDPNGNSNVQHLTAAQVTKVNATSGTNTGDETLTSIKTKLGAATSVSDGYLRYQDFNTLNGKQNQLNGTGFVKASGTTISYDNSTYLLTSSQVAPILIEKQTVDSVKNLNVVYPTAEFGFASRVIENGFIYSFNGVEWKNTGRKLFESELNAIVGSSNSNINYNLIIAKKMFGLGDSFMEGEFFAELVAKNLKCLLVKDGIGGSCITGGMENAEGDGTTRVSIVNRIDAALATNPSVLLIQGGSNDWYYQSPLGTINSTDVNTYYGALKYIAEKCASKLQKIVVVPINLMVRNTPKKSGGVAGRTNYINQRQYADAFVEVFKMYGIQTCDIFNNLSVTFENSEFYTIDGCHPNLAGKVRLSNYISQWIISNASVGLNESQVITGEYVNWINLYKFTFSDNVLSSVSGGWVSSARGDKSFVSKSVFSGVQAKLNMPTQNAEDGVMIGFSDIEPSSVAFPRYNAIRYALYWTAQSCAVWENGIQQGNSISLAGGNNSFAIQLRDGNVEYIINSVTVRTVPVVGGLVLFPVATSTNNPTIINCDLTIN